VNIAPVTKQLVGMGMLYPQYAKSRNFIKNGVNPDLTFPKEIKNGVEKVGFNFRRGVPDNCITRFDPYSLDFESSINWDDKKFLNRSKLYTQDKCIEQLTLKAFERPSNSTMMNTFLQKPDPFSTYEWDMDVFNRNQSLIGLSHKELSELTGRSTPRFEEHFEITNSTRVSKSVVVDYFKNVLTAWSTSCETSGVFRRAVYSRLRKEVSISDFYRNDHGSVTGNLNVLLNIFEIVEDEDRCILPAICLSFMSVRKGSLASPTNEATICRVYHVWFTGVLKEGYYDYLGSHSQPFYYGLGRLETDLHGMAGGINPNTHTVILGDEEFNREVKCQGMYAKSRVGNSIENSSGRCSTISSLYYLPGSSLEYLGMEANSEMPGHRFNNTPKISALRKVIYWLNQTAGNYSASEKEVLSDWTSTEHALPSELKTFEQEYLSFQFNKIVGNSAEKISKDYQTFYKAIAEPEFKANLNLP
jgi:hypothetical protein